MPSLNFVSYNKPYCTPSQLLTHMQTKGLQISNPQQAQTLISQINYYRFKIYLVPFWDESNQRYQSNSQFEDALQLYRFDEALRNWLFQVIGRIEIKLRTKLDQTISQCTQNPFWYLDDQLFQKNKLSTINSTRDKLAQEFKRSKLAFAGHYKSKYFNQFSEQYKELPPFWMLAELSTLGNIMVFYSAIDKQQFSANHAQLNQLDLLANEFGAQNLAELNNWLMLIRDIRNHCAHHSRLWNVNLREPKGIRNKLTHAVAHNNRIYLALVMLHLVEQSLKLNANIKSTLQQLIASYPAVEAHLHSAGFPKNWQQDGVWS